MATAMPQKVGEENAPWRQFATPKTLPIVAVAPAQGNPPSRAGAACGNFAWEIWATRVHGRASVAETIKIDCALCCIALARRGAAPNSAVGPLTFGRSARIVRLGGGGGGDLGLNRPSRPAGVHSANRRQPRGGY